MEDVFPVDIEFRNEVGIDGKIFKKAYFRIRGITDAKRENFYIFLSTVEVKRIVGTKYVARRKTREAIEDWDLWCGRVPKDAR